MGKRTTIIAVAALAVLLAGIVLAVVRLYRPQAQDGPSALAKDSAWNILAAIPSDAAAVAVFDGSSKASAALADSTGLLQGLFAPDNASFVAYLQELGRCSIAVSLHNSGSMVPLVVAETAAPDSVLTPVAARAGLKTLREGGFLLASRSETFLNAGARALQEGHSLLDTRPLQELVGHIDAPAVLLIAHSHAPKLVQTYAGKGSQSYATLFRNITSWSAWKLQTLEKDEIVLVGEALPGEKAASYLFDFHGAPSQRPEFPEVLPHYTSFALSQPIAEADAFFAARRREEDGLGHLMQFNKALKDRGGRPLNPEAWFASLQPKEAVYASFKDEKDVPHEAVLLRCGKDNKFGAGSPNAYRGCLATVLGTGFAVQDSVCASVGRWAVFADEPTVKFLTQKQEYTLKNRLSDASVSLPGGTVAYVSFTDDPSAAERIFDKRLARPLERLVSGSGFAPAAAALDLSGDRPFVRVQFNTRPFKESKVAVQVRDTTVEVPAGKFPVTNSATGKTNYLYQNKHLSLCLQDENGKDVWGVPFKEPLCGRVQDIDYFQNKKIQFLFCAGSTLYAMDRLGRWVNDFPVKLPKEVLLGPDVYDFTGAGGYTVMILHKDNTLERYNLHGEKVQGWKGIQGPETIKDLPQLIEKGGKRYWQVRTAVRTLTYPFEGGEPVKLK
jgi:hypothetical protein